MQDQQEVVSIVSVSKNTQTLILFHFSSFQPSVLQVVKDRVCLRALEKMIYQLVDSKEQTEILSATALQPLDVNADGTCAIPVDSLYKSPPQTPLSICNKYCLCLCLTGFILHDNSCCRRIVLLSQCC